MELGLNFYFNSDDNSRLPPDMNTETTTHPKAPESPFEALKVGDMVIVDASRYGGEHLTAARIFRVTDTQIVLRQLREGCDPLDARYYRKDGRRIGTDAYSREKLCISTPELLARIEKAKLVNRLTALKWKDLHLDTLRAVNAAIKTPTP